MKKYILILLTLISMNLTYSQCTISAFELVGSSTLDCGDSLVVGFSAFASSALQDTFSNTGPSDTAWQTTSGAIYTNPYIPSPTNDAYFWMGPSATVPTSLTTVPLNVSGGGQVCFDFVYAVQGGASPTEGPDLVNEGISFQYSTDGGITWIDIVYFVPNGTQLPSNPGPGAPMSPGVTSAGTPYTTWNSICFPIPAGAMTVGTSFQWIQEYNSGSCCDHWGMDNISITSANPAYLIHSVNSDSILGAAPQTYPVYTTTDSTYYFYYTDGSADTCYTDITVTVNPTDLGPDLILDCNNNVVQLQATGISLNDNFVWSPTNYLSDTTILNPTASPLDTTAYTITSSCGADTVLVSVIANYSFSTSPDTTICVGESAVLEVFGGAQSVAWTPNDGSINDTTLHSPTFSPTTTTTYTVVADSAGCLKTNTITIYVSNKIFPLVLPTGAGCSGTNAGSIISVSTGGLGTIEFTLHDGVDSIVQPLGFFNTLASGTYVLSVRDSMHCVSDTTIVITGGFAVGIDSVTLVNPSCAGATDGYLEIHPDTIVAGTTFSIDGGATTQTATIFNNLSDGTYNLEVAFGSTCPPTTQVEVLTAPTAVTINLIDTTDLSCYGANDGIIEVNGVNGSMPYQFGISDTSYTTDSTFTGLASGNYVIYVMDDNGCKDSLVTDLTEPNPLTINNIVVNDNQCYGDTLGSISFDAVNGTLPYSYSIDGGSTYSTSNNFTGLASGAYIIQAMDTNGCMSLSFNDTIIEPTPLVLNLDSTTSSSCGASDGAIYISGSGGTPNYSYSIDNGITTQTSGTFTGLVAGTYSIIFTDSNGCYTTMSVTISDLGAPTLSINTFDSVTCLGLSDATVELSATGGILPYQFSMDMGILGPDSVFTNINGGIHSFIVEDAIGCQGSVSITIYEPAALNISATVDSTSCNDFNDGEIHITASGGSLPFIYALDDTLMTQSSSDFLSQSSGSYTAYVVDDNGCMNSTMATIYQPDTLIITAINPVDISCSADGSFTVNAQGGTMPYFYSINGGTTQTSNTFTIITGGTYTLGVTDANGCPTALAIDTIDAPSAVTFTIDTITTTLACNNSNDGLIGITATGGVGPHTYSIDNGVTYQTNNSFTNLSAGTYNIVIQDAFGCLSTMSTQMIGQPNALTGTSTSNSVSCYGNMDGEVVISSISGGTAPYSVTVNGISNTYVPNLTFAGIAAGNVTIDVTDVNGCTLSWTETVSDVTPIGISLIDSSNVSCYGAADASLEVSASGGVTPYTFEITFGSLINTIVSNSSALFDNLEGSISGINYTISVTDVNGCSSSIVQTIFQNNQLNIDSMSSTPISCFGYLDGMMAAHITGGATPFVYDWQPSGYAGAVIDGVPAGTQTVTVTDANGCIVTASETIAAVDPLLATITPDSASISMGDTVQFGVNVQNGIGGLTYSWTPTTGLSCTDCENPVVTVYNDITYSVSVTDSNGCYNYNTNEVYVLVDNSTFFFIPNSFTPNGDGLNDNFQIFGKDIKSVDLMVFNRWGEKVFEGGNQFATWDGSFKGQTQTNGVYSYVADIEFLNDSKVHRKGSVSLIK